MGKLLGGNAGCTIPGRRLGAWCEGFNQLKEAVEMARNVGQVDRVVRFLVAIILAVLFFSNVVQGALGIVLLVIGIVLFVTGLTGSCPAYSMLKISTCKRQE